MNTENITQSERSQTKDHILYGSIYTNTQNIQFHRNRKQTNGCIGLGVEGENRERHQRDDLYKRKKGKFEFIKIKNVCSAKDPVKKMKRQDTEWENIFANHRCDQGSISRVYQEISKLNIKENSPRNWAKNMKRDFAEDIWITNKHMKKYGQQQQPSGECKLRLH